MSTRSSTLDVCLTVLNQVLSIMTRPDQSEPSVSPASIPRYYSQLKKAHKERVVPELREEDIEETFVRGAGSFVLVPYHLLIHVFHAHRKWSWRAICEQDGEQCATDTQANWYSSMLSRDSLIEAEQEAR